ncbi:ABC transporter permease [Rhodovarius lipocyclicus]|uniref:ABC transporter permease n=1 Tax=Rhodovarius lipocyclicus TaxID=268410 RepID=UPI001356B945|nr:ABC transporter permease [Rhodovarius lipocyclicus]
MRLSHILHLGIKELRGLARDPMLIMLVVYAFTLQIYSASKALPETLNHAPIAIVDEDRSPLATRITEAFYPPFFTMPQMIDQLSMDRRMDAGLDAFALDIPPEFQRDLLAGRNPTVQLNVDATRMTQAFTGSGYVQNILTNEITGFIRRYSSSAPSTVELVLRARFNPELNQVWFGSVMNVIMSITMLSIVLTGAALIREREHGTVEHLLVMPVTPFEIMVAKLWSMGLVVLAASALSLLLVVQGALRVPIDGSVPLFLVGAALQIFATTSLGVFLATMAGSMPQFGLLLMLVLLPLQLLSGSVTPRESMPEAVQIIMLAAPNTHFVMLAQTILYRAGGLELVWPQFIALGGIGCALFALALWRFRASLK